MTNQAATSQSGFDKAVDYVGQPILEGGQDWISKSFGYAIEKYRQLRSMLPNMIEDRNARLMMLRTVEHQQSKISDTREVAAFIDVFRDIRKMMPDLDSVQLVSPRDGSLSLRVNKTNEIRVIPSVDSTSGKTRWEVVFDNRVGIDTQSNPIYQDVIPTRVKIVPELYNSPIHNDGNTFAVQSPAGLADYITKWMRDAYRIQCCTEVFITAGRNFNEHERKLIEKYKQKESIKITTTHIDDRFSDAFDFFKQKVEAGLAATKSAFSLHGSYKLKHWSSTGLLTEAHPTVFYRIFDKHMSSGDSKKIEQLTKHLVTGLAEIAYLPQDVFKDRVSSSLQNALFIEQKLEILAQHLQPRQAVSGMSIEDRFNITPVAVTPLALNFIATVDKHANTMNKVLSDNLPEHGNHFRVFAQVDDSMHDSTRAIVVQNNVAWVKNEIISLATERCSGDDSVRMSLLAEALKRTDVPTDGFTASDTPLDYCQKVLSQAIPNLDPFLEAEKRALLSLAEDIKTPQTDVALLVG